MRVLFCVCVAVLCLFWGKAATAEILSVTAHTSALRSSPSVGGSYVVVEVPRYYPLQVLATQGDFMQVRDYRGREGWVPRAEVGLQKGVVVNRPVVNVRSGPGERHEVLFQARRGVALRVMQEQMSWLQVVHESGRNGWVHKSLVWGL
ncbi:SH3 domain-containing protein [Geoalkalibacter halelectricus]|uniref:SH3 domain-containing protein n=1 Tax=Geoalkalibacter halelectricus TaxID=2847045 RepID=A0ABY5ZNM4_9BACT|nr:SH3 domain-containing protein [Geoalkalibacter halelectricus]MDO3378437.1 SH3 domain-containing protein [Geoalkalibacter halelectricus]UWZ80243.1 SH3 domain-containing protein [Geoalkalibacter halelectricus]